MENAPHVVILAAGKGKRMRSHLPKALHPVLFRPMIQYVLGIAAGLPHRSLSVVVGEGEEEVEDECRALPGLAVFRQKAPLGTGHAVLAAGQFLRAQQGPVLILSADVILLKAASLKRMLERHLRESAAGTIGTTTLANPRGYGRVMRALDGRVTDIREEADCAGIEKAINEVNAGIYYFQAAELFGALEQISDQNAEREYYLTDAVKVLVDQGRKVVSYCFGDPEEVTGIDDRQTLSRVETTLQQAVNKALMHAGVTLQDPGGTWIDPRCRFEEDVRVEAGCVLVRSVIQHDVVIEGHCRIVDSCVGAGSRIKQGSYLEGALVGESCTIGPYAHLRKASRVGRGKTVGDFVELEGESGEARSRGLQVSER